MNMFRPNVLGVVSLLLLCFLFARCEYNSWTEEDTGYVPLPVPTMDIATLRGLYYDRPVEITGGVVLRGSVTASDESGNFYRSFMLEDATGAVEIRAGLYDMHNVYRTGARVVVAARSLTLGMEDALLQLGLGSDGRGGVGYMDHRAVAERYLFRTGESSDVVPETLPVSGLRDEKVGCLVRIEGLRLDPPCDTTWALPSVLSATGVPRSADLKFRTPTGDSLYVFTSGYASFAAERVPVGPLRITGILLRGKVNGRSVYRLKIRDLYDVEEIR